MPSETKVGQLVIDLKIKTEALEKGLETAKKKVREIENENKSIENSNKNLENSWVAVAATAGIALAGIISSIKSATEEYKAHEQAMSSLQNISDYTGESMSDLSDIMEKYEGIMTKTDLATTIKNFTLMGYSAKDTEKMIESLTNSAIRNRNANYTVSEAVRVASEGYRQGLSTLSDSAGVTENLSVMLDNYAKSIGKTASQLTEAEKNQAYLNRTMYAAEPFAGAMESYLDSLAGKQGQYSQTMRETQVAFTESLEPTLIKLEEMKTGLISTLGEYIEKNKAGTAGIVSFGVALTSLIVIIKLANTAMKLLNATMLSSPAMWIIGILSTLAGVVVSVTTAIEKQKQEQQELKEEQEEYNAVLNDTLRLESERISKINQDAEAINEYLQNLKEQRELQVAINSIDNAMQGVDKDSEMYKKLENGLKDLGGQLTVVNTKIKEQSEKFKKKFEIEKNKEAFNNIIKPFEEVINKLKKRKNKYEK